MTEYFLSNIFTFIDYFSNYKSLSRCSEEYENLMSIFYYFIISNKNIRSVYDLIKVFKNISNVLTTNSRKLFSFNWNEKKINENNQKSTSKMFKVNNLNELKSKYLKCIKNSDVSCWKRALFWIYFRNSDHNFKYSSNFHDKIHQK